MNSQSFNHSSFDSPLSHKTQRYVKILYFQDLQHIEIPG